MFEVFFEPVTEDDFEFNHALWLLSGFVIRGKLTSSDPTIQSKVTNAKKEIQEMRTRLQKTKKYQSLESEEKKKVRRGIGIRNWKSVAKSAGFGEKYIQLIYAYLSGYVHADGLSSTQIATAQSKQVQIGFIERQMRTIMIVLAKMIINYAKKFPEAKAVCDKNPDIYYQAEILAGAASRLP